MNRPYSECIPIRTRISSVWMVRFDNGVSKLLVLDKQFEISQVVAFLQVYHSNEKFKVRNVDVGQFNVESIEDAYYSDARWVDNELNSGMFIEHTDF